MEPTENFAFNFEIGEEATPKPKFVVRGNTIRERSQKRKQVKILKQNFKLEKEKAEAVSQSSDDDAPDVLDSGLPTQRSLMKRKMTNVTSSLFTKNPEVPTIQKSDVSQIVEDVFSDQKFNSVDYLHPHMVKNLETRMGVSTMTAIQCRSIPAIMACEQDVLVQSQTGSGKTLAYAIPVVNQLQSERPKLTRADGTFAIILVPTRELALQTYECLTKLVYPFTWLVPGSLMGGEKRKAEKARIRRGINILVATPGRMQDHLEKTECLNLHRLKWIIIDEADRLLDLGYEKSLNEILMKIKEKSDSELHTVLMSATLSKGVERLAGMTLKDPLHLSLNDSMKTTNTDEGTESFAIPESLSQKYTIVPMKLRLVTLSTFIMDKFMNTQEPSKILVFLSTHISVDFHYDIFTSVICRKADPESASDWDSLCCLDHVKSYKLHGEMPQSQRMETFQDFVKTKSGVLFCTDVAARGLHLPKVQWIIQYTAPASCSEYIHRIGRTARAGTKGQSLLFLLPSESDYIDLLNQQKISLEPIDMHSILKRLILTTGIQKNKKPLHNQTITQNATLLQSAFEQYVGGHSKNMELAGKACVSFIRGYSAYPKNVKNIFSIKSLHLGHVAKSFALREAPKNLGLKYGGLGDMKERSFADSGPSRKRSWRVDASKISEFSSGLDNDYRKKKKVGH